MKFTAHECEEVVVQYSQQREIECPACKEGTILFTENVEGICFLSIQSTILPEINLLTFHCDRCERTGEHLV
ncbi:hypothetical protein LFE_0530 [Leptospirillum ferrooxidans C2-3]|uniref:Uncharacterized protein n=1 Tax=Leptospirillum ferrooxidans (strain C2-3) TaxID=1162668 RepID=I0ILU7_LEPFC|nr:hypothetical protein LFE_0530 [Leptospirillum ferrooxidans C2-3]